MYIIIELQTTNGQTAHIVTTKEDRNEALSTFHSILAAAAISKVDTHTAVVMDERGNYVAIESFVHKEEEQEQEE